MTNKKITIILIITTIVFNSCRNKPSLSQDQFITSTENKFIYELGSTDEPKTISDDSTYYELRTRYDDIRITDIGTKHEIDSIKPIRAEQVIELWNEY